MTVGNKGQEADPPVADIFVMNDRTSPDYCPAIAPAAVWCEVRTDNGDTAPNHALSTPSLHSCTRLFIQVFIMLDKRDSLMLQFYKH